MSGGSQIGWVDFSSADRDRVKHALKQLIEPGTLDELGVGALRDAFADRLFPGFSTLQTRAKYFITVPRIIRDYLQLSPGERRRTSAIEYLEEREAQLSERLREVHPGDVEKGISGSSLNKGERVARQPSSTYWVGLRTWNLVDSHGSLRQFLHTLEAPEEHVGAAQGDERDDADAQAHVSQVRLDRYHKDWFETVSIHLTRSEAQFLREKIRTRTGMSLPTELEQCELTAQALVKGQAGFAALAAWVADQPRLSSGLRETVAMAQAFSELSYGAHLRFNMLLVRNDGLRHRALLSEFEAAWQAWRAQVQASADDVASWIAHTNVVLKRDTLTFLERWAEGVGNGSADHELEQWVGQQARANKLGRSVLNKPLPEGFKWLGMARQDYRWSQVRTLLGDIQEGLAC